MSNPVGSFVSKGRRKVANAWLRRRIKKHLSMRHVRAEERRLDYTLAKADKIRELKNGILSGIIVGRPRLTAMVRMQKQAEILPGQIKLAKSLIYILL